MKFVHLIKFVNNLNFILIRFVHAKLLRQRVSERETVFETALVARCYAIAAYAVVRCPSVCPSVRLSRSWTLSKRINQSLNFFHHRVATPF